MSECISVVIYYDCEENIAQLVFNQNIDLIELRKRIRRKIFETMPMRVSSIKYQFCASVDPVTYDSFDIKSGRSLEEMEHTTLHEIPLVGGRTRKHPCLVEVWNIQLLHNTRLVDGTCTSVGRCLMMEINNKSDVDPPQEPSLDGAEVTLFFEPEPVPIELEDVEGGLDEKKEDP
ncbi:hypothetical protein J1N35_043346 [Gossypium stocksii]|uniref:Uncharacterized protein n=1 Tax=Gossypium stocksii TaxID=47602 RepID=A0A9D3U768_9ROSI|nr:hypothetical protein J1N35_043346 [Gossypium stocksii]